jgi:hypothetical protein
LIANIQFCNQIEQLLLDSSASSQVWDEVSSILKENVQYDRMVIASTDVPRALFSPILITGVSVPDWDTSPVHRMADSLIGESVKSNSPVMSDHIVSVYTRHGDGDLVGVPNAYWASTLGMRIVNGGEIVGAIVFLSHTPDLYGPDQKEEIEQISRILGPYLSHQLLQKEILKATEHQSNLEYLLQHFNNSQDPSTFFNTFYSVFASKASLVHGALFSYDRYSDKYVPIANVDGIGDPQNPTLERGTQLVNEHRLSGESVHLACKHKSVPVSNVGASLMELVDQSAGFKSYALYRLPQELTALVPCYLPCPTATQVCWNGFEILNRPDQLRVRSSSFIRHPVSGIDNSIFLQCCNLQLKICAMLRAVLRS